MSRTFRQGASLPRPVGQQSQTERRLRHECEQLKLALAKATVQLRIWQKGSEFVDADDYRPTAWSSGSSAR